MLKHQYLFLLENEALSFINSPVENKNDLELEVSFLTDSCCSDLVDDESN